MSRPEWAERRAGRAVEPVDGLANPSSRTDEFGARCNTCVYRKRDSASTHRADSVKLRLNGRPAQALSCGPGFALQVESPAGGRESGPAPAGQCASARDVQAACSEKHRSPAVCLALSLFPLNRRRSCHCQAGNSHSLAPDRLPGLLALAIAQSHWQTESVSRVALSHWRDEPSHFGVHRVSTASCSSWASKSPSRLSPNT